MESLKEYLNRLICMTLTEKQLENIDKEVILDQLQERIEYEMESQEEWWQDKIKEMI